MLADVPAPNHCEWPAPQQVSIAPPNSACIAFATGYSLRRMRALVTVCLLGSFGVSPAQRSVRAGVQKQIS
jgi:hypothetical protein